MNDNGGLSQMPGIDKVYKDVKYETIKAMIEMISSNSAAMILSGFETALTNKAVVANIKNNMMPYLYAGGLLSFAAREITEKSMSDVMNAIGVQPNPVLIRILLDSGMKSHIAYVYAYFFLLANGVDITADGILSVIKALGLPPDRERALDILKFKSQD